MWVNFCASFPLIHTFETCLLSPISSFCSMSMLSFRWMLLKRSYQNWVSTRRIKQVHFFFLLDSMAWQITLFQIAFFALYWHFDNSFQVERDLQSRVTMRRRSPIQWIEIEDFTSWKKNYPLVHLPFSSELHLIDLNFIHPSSHRFRLIRKREMTKDVVERELTVIRKQISFD